MWAEVESRLIETSEARVQKVLNHLRNLAPRLDLQREQAMLDEFIGATMVAHKADMQTQTSKAHSATPIRHPPPCATHPRPHR